MATTPVNPNLSATAARSMSPEQFESHRQQEQKRREDFASQFPDINKAVERTIISLLPGGVNPQEVIVETRGRNEEEDEKLAEVRKVHRRMAEIGVIPASIINLHPWPIQGNGRYLMYSDMTVPPCPIGTAYTQFVIRQYKIDLEDKGGRFGADTVLPIMLARDLVQQLFPQKEGGLFEYMGDHQPGQSPKTRDKEMSAWDKAKKAQLAEYRRRFREADSFFQQGGRLGMKNITDKHRLIAQWLLHYRYLQAPPAWLTASREQGEVPDACPKCGEEVLEAGFACGNCGYIIDPYRAFQGEDIEDTHNSLRRLTREQLDELGLDYVLTSEEYRKERRSLAESEIEEEPAQPAAQQSKRTRGSRHKRARRVRTAPPTENVLESKTEPEPDPGE